MWIDAMREMKEVMVINTKDLSDELKARFEERANGKVRAISLACFVVGIVLIIGAFADSANEGVIFYIGILAGLALSIYGGVKAAFGSTILTDTKTGSPVEVRSIYFAASDKNNVISALENEKWDALKAGKSCGGTLPLCLKAWYTKDGGYASAMLMEYVPYQYVPVGKLKEVSAETRQAFIGAIC